MTPLWVVGSGGHAAVVIDAARAGGQFEVMGCLDDDRSRTGQQVLGVEVRGGTSEADLNRLGVEIAVIAIGNNAIRRKFTERLNGVIAWATVIHPGAQVADSARIGNGSVVLAGAIVQPRTDVDNHTIVNTAATVDHDGRVEKFVHVGPGCHLAGNVTVGEGTQLGAGCIAIPGACIGEWVIVGAGAVVTRDIQAHVTAVGSPAKVIKQRRPDWYQ